MIKKILAMFLAAMMIFAFVGCSDNKKSSNSDGKVIEVSIPSYRTGENSGAKYFVPMVERFNKKYEDKYKIKLEQTNDTTHTDHIKALAQQNKLPVVFQIADSNWVDTYLIANNKLDDLSSFINDKADLKKLLISSSVDYCTKDGKILAMPLTVLRSTGLYYNSQLLSPAKAITEMSWDELSDALKDNKIAFQTGDGGWTTSLTLAAIMGSIEGGVDILEKGVTNKITDFNSPQFIEAFTILQKMAKKHSWDGAVGVDYAPAANTFYSSQTAILPDGTWIIDTVYKPDETSGGFDGSKVVGDFYPGNVAIANPKVYDWMVSASASKEEKELAYAFLEFMNTPAEIEAYILAEGGAAPNLTYSADFESKIKENKLLNDFAVKTNSSTKYVPYFHDTIDEALLKNAYTNMLADLFRDKITPTEFCEKLTQAAKE